MIRLNLEQIVKKPATGLPKLPAKLSESTFPLSERSITTNIVVHNGDTAVLGGLIRDEESVVETKVPILGDIPVLGWLFKSNKKDSAKINLNIFITPKIIRSTEDSQKLLSKKTNDRIDWLKRNYDGRDPYGKVIDTLPRAALTDSDIEDVDEPIGAGARPNHGAKSNLR
jgi:general secretion pathway protein D